MHNRVKLGLLAVLVAVMGLGQAMADGEPGTATITTVQTALGGTITALVTAGGVLAVAALGVWAIPFVIRKVKSFISAA